MQDSFSGAHYSLTFQVDFLLVSRPASSATLNLEAQSGREGVKRSYADKDQNEQPQIRKG